LTAFRVPSRNDSRGAYTSGGTFPFFAGIFRSRPASSEFWPGYKTSEGIEPALLAQFELLEEVLLSAGIVVWPMVEFEADDALAAAAAKAARDARVEHVIICTPDKDLAQCVRGTRIVAALPRVRQLAN
jgi:5'-3' exonuclease